MPKNAYFLAKKGCKIAARPKAPPPAAGDSAFRSHVYSHLLTWICESAFLAFKLFYY